MRRGSFARQLQTMRRIARQEAVAATGGPPAGAADASRTASAGSYDRNTGEFLAYGLVGITTLGEGFRVPGERVFYGRVGVTAISSFRVTG